MTRRRKMAEAQPCPNCHKNRWRTVQKGRKWACRNCGKEREAA